MTGNWMPCSVNVKVNDKNTHPYIFMFFTGHKFQENSSGKQTISKVINDRKIDVLLS